MPIAFLSSVLGFADLPRPGRQVLPSSRPRGGVWREVGQEDRDGPPSPPDEQDRLEWILGAALGRRGAVLEARRLLGAFRNVRTCLDTPPHVMAEHGFDPRTVRELQRLRVLIEDVLLTRLDKLHVLSNFVALREYLVFALGAEPEEQARVLYLDKALGLIRDELHARGTVDFVGIYVRELARRALELNATSIILVHNHPAGKTTPSSQDVETTRLVIDAMTPLGIDVLDHMIVARDVVVSMKGTGMM